MGNASRSSKRRWLIGGVAALGLVALGGVMRLSAAGSDNSSSFVPITPCRLMDTRVGTGIGPRHTPIGAGETYSPAVWGANGNCNIPTSATAVSMNVTFVNPSATGYVTVFPPDQVLPTSSNLNFTPGQAPAPNAVNSQLSADGRVGFFNAFGTVNLIADIVGYYENAGSAPGGIVAGNCAAILRWDLPECKHATRTTGDGPIGVAFDGTSVWITNAGADTVSKMNPATGTKVDYPTLDNPQGIAFDGTNIWVANLGADKVSKFNIATGTRVDYATLDAPQSVAFDGFLSMWIPSYTTNMVSRVNRATGTKVDYATGVGPRGVAFDGTSIWVVNETAETVSKIEIVFGGRTDYPVGNNPTGIAFDGKYIYVSNFADDSLSQINPATGAVVGTLATGDGPNGIAFDGTSLWVANRTGDSVSRINPTTNTRIDYPVGNSPFGVAFDGSNIWVANNLADSVSKLVI